ncbi:PREDICTED: vegetative cell wall protein gp1-like [Wasmannia auropunctata]|uniref:vegetative cell wall protein gp1-like n=1 Tax=Wasmannia auropunctata TaxID=64793 RepID=UPI0005EDF629|nr:PREDICTED: vegetative cell wall protein gp1-like [Wasmannia auropunctata]
MRFPTPREPRTLEAVPPFSRPPHSRSGSPVPATSTSKMRFPTPRKPRTLEAVPPSLRPPHSRSGSPAPATSTPTTQFPRPRGQASGSITFPVTSSPPADLRPRTLEKELTTNENTAIDDVNHILPNAQEYSTNENNESTKDATTCTQEKNHCMSCKKFKN